MRRDSLSMYDDLSKWECGKVVWRVCESGNRRVFFSHLVLFKGGYIR